MPEVLGIAPWLGGAGASGGVLQALMTLLMAEKLDLPLGITDQPSAEPEKEDA